MSHLRNLRHLRRSAAGFTLIEMLITMTLIITLAAVAAANYRHSVRRSEEAVLKTDLFRLREAMDQFYADRNKWPADLTDLVTAGYIRDVPVDPITKSKGTWITEMAEPDPNRPVAAGGIHNVRSGSDRLALDGTRYATDW